MPYVAGFSAGSDFVQGFDLSLWSFQCPMWRAFRLDRNIWSYCRTGTFSFQCPMWRAFRLDLGGLFWYDASTVGFSALCGGLFGWIVEPVLIIAIVSSRFSALCGGLFGWIDNFNFNFSLRAIVSVPYVAGFSAGSERRGCSLVVLKEFQCPMWRAFRLDQLLTNKSQAIHFCFSALCGGLFGWIIWYKAAYDRGQ